MIGCILPSLYWIAVKSYFSHQNDTNTSVTMHKVFMTDLLRLTAKPMFTLSLDLSFSVSKRLLNSTSNSKPNAKVSTSRTHHIFLKVDTWWYLSNYSTLCLNRSWPSPRIQWQLWHGEDHPPNSSEPRQSAERLVHPPEVFSLSSPPVHSVNAKISLNNYTVPHVWHLRLSWPIPFFLL